MPPNPYQSPETPQRYQISIGRMLAAIGAVSVCFGLMRLAGNDAWIVGVVTASFGAILISRRVFHLRTASAALIGWLVSILASIGFCFVTSCLTAFSPPPKGIEWFHGGGWDMVLTMSILGAIGGFIWGLLSAIAYIGMNVLGRGWCPKSWAVTRTRR